MSKLPPGFVVWITGLPASGKTSLAQAIAARTGMMIHFERITGEWLPIAVALLGSTVITMLASALIMAAASRLFAPGERQDD